MLGISSYDYYEAIHADDPINPTILIDMGEWTVVRWETAIDLSESESYQLKSGDAIETKDASKGTITWPDHSVTRMWANTRIVISKMEVNQNYDSIKISMEMKRGKIWSNVVRTMIGDSYFETKLPKNNIVAAVRWTVYEINLDGGYIHAVTHSMELSDISGKSLSLLPGELVSSDNIWIKKGKEILDATWETWNNLTDQTYLKTRTDVLIKNMNLVDGTEKANNIFDQFTRWILSWFPSFDALNITKQIQANNINWLIGSNLSTLVEYYQKYQGSGFLEERDTVRNSIMQKISETKDSTSLLLSLKNSAVWDMVENTNIALPWAEKVIGNWLDQIQWSIQEIRDVISQKNLNENMQIQVKKWLSF